MVDRSPNGGGPSWRISRARLRRAGDSRLVGYIRRGDPLAFEVLYDRYARDLLSFCRYMLGSQADAEDAVQKTFSSAHRALLADDRAVELRPWLFAIARNASLSMLRKRPPTGPFDECREPFEDPADYLEQREEVRQVAAGLRLLPERQRAALVLTQVYGFTLAEVSGFLRVRPEQVKAYVYQARSNLVAEREALSADCRDIREELATARGSALRKSRLRRHLEWHPFDGLLMALVAWTRKDASDATNQTAVSAGVSPRSCAARAVGQNREGRIGCVGVQRAVAA